MFTNINDKSKEWSPEELGGKGFGLWWMAKNGVNVPPAFVIPTSYCVEYMKNPDKVMGELPQHLEKVYFWFEKVFGYMPLLSVRSGARVSMPGMMDTLLNVGLTHANMGDWKTRLGEECAINCKERLDHMFKDVVGKEVPDTWMEQMILSIKSVFDSWNNERAVFYRQMNKIPEDWGTAVVVQAMVFGNMNQESCTGVLFTRNPDNGVKGVTGEFLPNAQGEDVVAGTVTPLKLSDMEGWNTTVYNELISTVLRLEEIRGDVQDVEFTVQNGVLYILQTRNAKRSARAAIKIALDMHGEGIKTEDQVLESLSVRTLWLAMQPVIDPSFSEEADYVGIPACSGVVTGVVVTSSEDAVKSKVPCILVTKETTPNDIKGMSASVGILTMTGGSTSHAAVVARGMNKPCVVGLLQPMVGFKEGTEISICGETGRVWLQAVPVVDPKDSVDVSAVESILLKKALGKVVSTPQEPVVTSNVIYLGNNLMDRIETLVDFVKSHEGEGTDLTLDFRIDAAALNYYETVWGSLASRVSEKVQQVVDALDKKKKVVVLAEKGVKLPKGVKSVPSIVDLRELILHKAGDFVWSGETQEAEQAVLEWKKAEGMSPVTYGGQMIGSYMSMGQVMNLLLD